MVWLNLNNCPFVLLVIVSFAVAGVCSGKVPIKKRSLVALEEPADDVKLSLSKRTFCNGAFRCGGKRGELQNLLSKQDYEYDQGMIDLGGLGDSDSSDDIARDILAEARLYEALQARNTMRILQNRREGFFPLPRQKRAVSKSNRSGNDGKNPQPAHNPNTNPTLVDVNKSPLAP